MRIGTMVAVGVMAGALGLGPVEAGGHGGKDRSATMLQRLQEELALTPEQAGKVEAILAEARTQAEAERDATGGDRRALREKRRERMRQVDDQISALLTEEQKAKHKEMKEKRRERMRDRREPGAAPPGS